MHTKIQSQIDLSTLITLDEAKRQCRLIPSFTHDDDDLNHLIASCAELAQTYTYRLLTPGTISAEADEYSSVLLLPWGNVSSVSQVMLDDVEYSDFSFSEVTGKLKIQDPYSNIKITYEAGYQTLPIKVKQGILMMISTFYNNREDYIAGMNIEQIPLCSTRILDSVRYWNV